MRFCFALVAALTFAFVAQADELEQGARRRLQLLEDHMSRVREDLRKKTQHYNLLQNGSGSPQFAWEDASAAPERRRHVATLLRVGIQEQLRNLETLKHQRDEALADLEWVELQRKQGLPSAIPGAASTPAVALSCVQMPAEAMGSDALLLQQDFGPLKDADTGIEWQSWGWWLGRVAGAARACAEGTVVFAGKVPGRGMVVMLDHGQSRLTLYGNLMEDATLLALKGKRVAGGTVLGQTRDRFYFEARLGGHAVDPRKVLPASALSRVGIQAR